MRGGLTISARTRREILTTAALSPAQFLRRRGACSALLPCLPGIEPHPLPPRVRCVLQVAREIGKLFDLRGKDRGLHAAVFTMGDRTQYLGRTAALGYRRVHHLPLADELRRESGCAAALAGGTAQNQGIPTVFDDRVCVALPIGARYLGDGLKTEDAAPAEFSQAGQGVFQSIDLAQGVQLVDNEPEAVILVP